jgi:LuxR family maltose regulon positive regulatory protein
MADAELAVLSALDELMQGSLEMAERYLALAESAMAAVPDARQGQAQLLLGIVRLLHARQRGNLRAAAEEARRLQDVADVPDPTRPGLGEDLRALALINLGSAELWAAQLVEAEAPGSGRGAGTPDRTALSGGRALGLLSPSPHRGQVTRAG